jgi:hypothetical protein
MINIALTTELRSLLLVRDERRKSDHQVVDGACRAWRRGGCCGRVL